jgi:hypothetical protein
MPISTDTLLQRVNRHRCFGYPVFLHWARSTPDYRAVGALLHQIQLFCSSTRSGWNFPTVLKDLGLSKQSELVAEIVESEAHHGPEPPAMASQYVLPRC